jgi:endonuclease/exonuclease/phosphatase family metal-dependent hydrolase
MHALRLVVMGCALFLAVMGCGGCSARGAALSTSHPASAGGPAAPGSSRAYSLMQMNLCLSGLAECYVKVAYPAAVAEAESLIGEWHPDAVTINEACSGDAARIARRTGYHMRFSTVIYGGKAFSCIQPGGRGIFGDAVLTGAPIMNSGGHAFSAQAGIEQRRWLCVTTHDNVRVCTAHLATRGAVEVAGNQGQCRELAAILKPRRKGRAVIFGGDVNRLSSCGPAGFWRRTDATAEQDHGLQQAYGSSALRSPSVQVVSLTRSDHDVLLVGAHLARVGVGDRGSAFGGRGDRERLSTRAVR